KSNSSNDVWEDWSATSINWEMTMQAASRVIECESKGEHDGKIFDMTVDTSLASPAAPNMIVSFKSIAKIDDMSEDYVSGMDVDVNVSRPFVMAQAAYDGLQLEDQIVKFKDVEYGDNLPPKLASEAQKNQGRPVLMLVMKQGTSINLVVKHRTWCHRGLLGSCSTRASNYTIDPSNSIDLSLAQSRLVITLLTWYLDKAILFVVGNTLVCDDLEEAKIVIERLSLGKFHRV
nr:hypothetical protein [Tanacetum cinerariifolium]